MSLAMIKVSPDCLSELALDRYLADELPRDDRTAATRHLGGCVHCAGRRDQRLAEHASVQRALDAGELALPRPAAVLARGGGMAAPARPASPRRWSRRMRWPAAAAFASAAALALFIAVGRTGGPAGTVPGEIVHHKGGAPQLRYWVLRNGEVRPGEDAGPLMPGDAVRFGYRGSQAGFLALIAVDGLGQVSVYSPDDDDAWPAPAGTDVLLPNSVVLDDAPGPETVHAVFCRQQISIAPLRAALGRGAPLGPLAPGCEIATLVLDKVLR